MLDKSKRFLISFTLLALCFIGEIIYLNSTHTFSKGLLEQKRNFVRLTGLPDLAIMNESRAARHRSLNTMATTYEVDGSLREFDRSSYVLNHASKL